MSIQSWKSDITASQGDLSQYWTLSRFEIKKASMGPRLSSAAQIAKVKIRTEGGLFSGEVLHIDVPAAFA